MRRHNPSFTYAVQHEWMSKRSKPSPKPTPETLDDLYRAVRVAPLSTPADKPASYIFALGLALVLFSIALGVIAYFWPPIKTHLKDPAFWLLGLGILAFFLSSVLSLLGYLFSVGKYVSERFHKSHMTSVKLAARIAANYPKQVIHDCLHTTRLELKINARAPAKLPILTGFVTAIAAATRYIFLLPSSDAAPENAVSATNISLSSGADVVSGAGVLLPEFAWIALSVALSVVVSRAIIHTTQDRLMRVESVLEKAATLAGQGRAI